jgi:hypothetical protein
VLFTDDALPGLADGSITVTFRNWKRPQAKEGGTFQLRGRLWFAVDSVQVVTVGSITKADAERAGEPDVAAVRRRLKLEDPGAEVYRIEFHPIPPAGPPTDEADLSPDDVAEIDRRLDRLDAASRVGAWTRPTLAVIGTHPGVVSTTLAEVLGRERFDLKLDIRKLKRLGLTISLGTGYELSPRGQAYLDARAENP